MGSSTYLLLAIGVESRCCMLVSSNVDPDRVLVHRSVHYRTRMDSANVAQGCGLLGNHLDVPLGRRSLSSGLERVLAAALQDMDGERAIRFCGNPFTGFCLRGSLTLIFLTAWMIARWITRPHDRKRHVGGRLRAVRTAVFDQVDGCADSQCMLVERI